MMNSKILSCVENNVSFPKKSLELLNIYLELWVLSAVLVTGG